MDMDMECSDVARCLSELQAQTARATYELNEVLLDRALTTRA